MERIEELLAKGIDKLTEAELEELETLCNEEADKVLDAAKEDPTDEQLAALEKIATTLEAVKTESGARETKKAERAAAVADLEKRIKGDDDAADADATVDADADADANADAPAAEPVATPVAAETTPVVEPVAAAGSPAPVITRVAARRPAATKPRVTSGERVASMTASANLPGMQAGMSLTKEEDMFRAWDQAVKTALTASLSPGSNAAIKIPVCGMSLDFPEERMLDDNARSNRRKIDAVSSREAITASGGACAPIPVRYDETVIGNEARPVRDALSRFGAVRGGIVTLVPPTLVDVSGAVGKWTMANDENPADPSTKPYLTIPCDNDERETEVYAVTRSVKIGNFRQKWFPEQVAAYMTLIGTHASRLQEAYFLKGIKDGSTVVTHGQVLGASRDVFTSLRQLIATIQWRLRAPESTRFAVIAPDWLRDMILIDLIRIGYSDTTEERLVRAESTLNAWFAALNCNVYWHIDYESGVNIGSPGGPLAGAQGAGPVIGMPDKARVYVYIEGSWLYLDGGSWDFGVFRDSTLVGTNDFRMFSEVAENVHYDGVPGESFAYDIDICANGVTVAADDIDVCGQGS